MELKKSVKADLEWRKPIFFQIGLVVSLLTVFLLFEFAGTTQKYETIRWGTGYLDEEIAILSPVKSSSPTPQQQPTDIKTVENNVRTENFTVNAEISEDAKIDEEENTRQEILSDIYAELHGGDENFIKLILFLQEHLKYPEYARKVNLEGKVLVGFVVEEDGSLANFEIVRSVAPILDNEVLRVFRLMPKWIPKNHNGRYVRARYQIPVTFALN